ncbi:alpha/beta fold hydrolase [Paenibacillus provencensis]|uniref:Alpha/beta fold hydrolase n=1 Tax=Paenibacillus provencensis TaxID=441151 RepID=A0ABW3PYM7_9BACL|nr:alpha/beta hydrolase [Paenibacillus sp. MER 78]MCM3127942.1 alpha/beta hydrolase [Paenibacillus sp. MER 78]
MHFAISKDGTQIAYDKKGNGPAVILVTGAFSYRKFPAQVELTDLLSEQFTVYNYDRRGRGDSGDTQPYAVQCEIEDLEAVIHEAGGSAAVWGLSSGAIIALQAAANGAAITKLALHEPPFLVEADGRKVPADFLQQVTRLIKENRRADAVKYFITTGMGAPAFVVGMMRMMPGVWSKLVSIAHTLPYDAAISDEYMKGRALPRDLWSSVKIPTAVLEGTESPAELRQGAAALAKVLPNAQLVSKKGLGHTKKLNAKLIASELSAFFAEGHSTAFRIAK